MNRFKSNHLNKQHAGQTFILDNAIYLTLGITMHMKKWIDFLIDKAHVMTAMYIYNISLSSSNNHTNTQMIIELMGLRSDCHSGRTVIYVDIVRRNIPRKLSKTLYVCMVICTL